MLALILITVFQNGVITEASDSNIQKFQDSGTVATFSVIDSEHQMQTNDMDLIDEERIYNKDGSVTVSETYTCDYISSMELESGLAPFSSTTQSENNVYWKGYVTITYTVDNTYAQFTKVSGYWTQLRGTSHLEDREVYYAYTLGLSYKGATKYPSTNEFSYDTGFSKQKYGGGSIIGCNSTATVVQEPSGLTAKLFVNCSKEF